MSFCRNCGSVIPNNPVICQHCKNEINYTPAFCSSCGKVIDIRPAYCNFCGKELRPALKEFAVEETPVVKEAPVETIKENEASATRIVYVPVAEPQTAPAREENAYTTVHVPTAMPYEKPTYVPMIPAVTTTYPGEPHKRRDVGSVVMGIISLVLGVIGLIYAFMFFIAGSGNTEYESILIASAIFAPLSIISLILSSKSRHYGFVGGVTKASKIISMIGLFTYAFMGFFSLMNLI